jgi:hypothetical protein
MHGSGARRDERSAFCPLETWTHDACGTMLRSRRLPVQHPAGATRADLGSRACKGKGGDSTRVPSRVPGRSARVEPGGRAPACRGREVCGSRLETTEAGIAIQGGPVSRSQVTWPKCRWIIGESLSHQKKSLRQETLGPRAASRGHEPAGLEWNV